MGIGANSAVFSLVNAVLLRPLAVRIRHPERLTGLYSRQVEPAGGYRGFSCPNHADIRDRNVVFQELAAYSMSMTALRDGDVTRRTFAGVVSARCLRTFAEQKWGQTFSVDIIRRAHKSA